MTRSAKEIWEVALGELELQVTRSNFRTWLKDTVGLSWSDGVFVVGTPSPFVAEWLEKRLSPLIVKTLARIVNLGLEVKFTIIPLSGAELRTRVASGRSLEVASPDALPSDSPAATTRSQTSLNPDYTFDTFVVGECNRLGYAAALSVAEHPGENYNPLFIYSDSGLGKTHLLQAIGNHCLAKGCPAEYVTTEHFTNEFIESLRERKTECFRQKYRSPMVLILDDIQFISGKEQTQEAFFHTFNDLHNAGRQIVLACDRPPSALALLESRLRSRFKSGLLADIQPPGMETRCAILQAKAGSSGLSLPQECYDFIAQRFISNVRDLEGALKRIVAFHQLTGASMTLPRVRECLSDMLVEEHEPLSFQKILDAICHFYGITLQDLTGTNRGRHLVHARQVAMYFLRQETNLSLVDIGKLLGNRHHGTVLHGYEQITKGQNASDILRRELQQIRALLRAV